MPQKIGILTTGWSDMSSSTHYLATFACFENQKEPVFPLLEFSPFLDESDLYADSHINNIEKVLAYDKKSFIVNFVLRFIQRFNKSSEEAKNMSS